MSLNEFDLKNVLAIEHSKSPLMALYEAIDAERYSNEPINIRPSGLVEFMDHGLSWATKQILKVYFHDSINTCIGTSVHKGAEYAYKTYLDSKTIPELNNCLLELALELRKKYKRMDHDKRFEKSVYISCFSAYKRAKALFTTYYPQIQKSAITTLSVEEKISYDNFQDNKGNSLNINYTGTLDKIEMYSNELCVTDIKTSKKAVGGKPVEVYDQQRTLIKSINEELKHLRPRKTVEDGIINPDLLEKVKSLKSQISSTSKTKIKDSNYKEVYQNTISKLSELKKHLKATRVPKELELDKEQFTNYKETIPNRIKELENELIKLEDAFKSELESQINKLKEDLESVENEIKVITKNYHDDRAALYESLSDEKADLEEIIQAAQHENDVLKLKEEHGLQIASYAILYELKYKKTVKYGKIERLVYSEKGSYFKSYVFDITDLKKKLLEILSLILDSIIAWKCDNVSARLLFRHNPCTFRGDELTKIFKEIELERKLM